MSSININKPLVSVKWLNENLNATNLIILDATIKVVTENSSNENAIQYIPSTRFFDLKYKFSDTSAPFPNTISTETQFTKEAQNLGINRDSAIVIYDTKGIYSGPRVWWLFKTMGYHNVAVLNGGLPEWISQGYNTTSFQEYKGKQGNFVAKYSSGTMRFFDDMKLASKDSSKCIIIDARSTARFKGEVEEPRIGLRSGTIPNSFNFPYTNLFNGNVFKSDEELKQEFNKLAKLDDEIIFSCGSGITACVLALGATLSGYKSLSIYDGSWTEWGSLINE
ncbi:sulfurtransferase [Flavobacteriaceae bacterium AU392]|nr:sulfurtransferase [Flavobacteriaceae bacterium]RKM85675.1 sulfurtransferase [Flavobacteriaceae bacterium AU392]